MKRLTKSSEHKVIEGLLGGIGEYFDTDPVLIRLLFVFATLLTGVVPGVIAYIIGVLIVPAPVTPSVPVHDSEAV